MVIISRSRYEQSSAEVAALQESSPFKNGEAEERKVRIFHGKRQARHMGVVHTARDARFFIRIECQHMADVQHEDAVDCRFGCEAKAREERERERERERRWRA